MSQQPEGAHTFASLVRGVVHHPLFPVVLHKTSLLLPSDRATPPPLSHQLTGAEVSATTLKTFAESNGLDGACERWTSTDVFMSALVAALNALPANIPMPNTVEQLITAKLPVQKDSTAIRKPPRTPVSERGKAALERWFQQHLDNPYPTPPQKEQLARDCNMSLSSVNNWFGNKRMRIKRKMLTVETNTFTQQSITDKVLAPRSKWNAVVVSKMNSQAGRDVVASATGRANLYATEEQIAQAAANRAARNAAAEAAKNDR